MRSKDGGHDRPAARAGERHLERDRRAVVARVILRDRFRAARRRFAEEQLVGCRRVERFDPEDVRVSHRGRSRACLLYTSPSPRDGLLSRMPSSA